MIFFVLVLLLVLVLDGFGFDYENEDDDEDDWVTASPAPLFNQELVELVPPKDIICRWHVFC